MAAPAGPIYDNALRMLAATDLVAVCRWLGIEVRPDSVRLSEALPAATHYADLIAQVGKDRLAHVEFVREPRPGLGQRMLEYRARIMAHQPGPILSQHVVVLDRGTVHSRVANGEEFAMRLHVTYLREHDPSEFLTGPSLAPLAVLGRAGDAPARENAFRDALEVLRSVQDPERREDLAGVAAVLAAIHLGPDTIERVGKEVGMPITLEGTVGGRRLEARAEARGEARATAGLLTALLVRTFGDDSRLDDLATRLARLPREQALDAVLTAESLTGLLATFP